MSVQVLDPGFLTTIQDAGRSGSQRLGVPASGAMDRFALLAANRLVGNPPAAAILEFALAGPTLALQQDCLVALTGCGFELELDGLRLPAWTAIWARNGQALRLLSTSAGVWGCLAFSGGLDVPLVMGSRSTCLPAGFGGWQGRPLQAGDCIPPGKLGAGVHLPGLAGRSLPTRFHPAYGQAVTLDVILGPQAEAFTPAGLETFLHNEYTVSLASDRMAYRLEGLPIAHWQGADILSDGIPLGAVQVPGNGQPLVLLADRQATGGYAKIAVVTSASLPALVQCPPGDGRVRFQVVTVEDAQRAWRELVQGLQQGIEEDNDEHG